VPGSEPTAVTHNQSREKPSLSQLALCWLLFFSVCLGLGYAGLGRYDPRDTPGLTDSVIYSRLVSGEPVMARDLRFRLLVPYLSKPFFVVGQSLFGVKKTALLSLLITNSFFCAVTACLLAGIGSRLGIDWATALLASCLYLLSFAVANIQLAGLVDSTETCFLLAVTWSLLTNRLTLLPVWAVLGALAKETFVPLAIVLALVWWLIAYRERMQTKRDLVWILSVGFVGVLTVTLVRFAVSGQLIWPWHTEIVSPEQSYLTRLSQTVISKEFWYTFAWLIPFGVWRLSRFPRQWLLASLAAALTAIALSAYKGVAGNMARPTFNVLGPILALSTALLIAGRPGVVNREKA
jgi:hypothetical protein